jgi:hypothetical protein
MPAMNVGDRVRLTASTPVLELPSRLGVIVRPDDTLGGYWVVRLDEPASYRDAIGGTVSLPEILEHESNLDVLP